MNSQSAKQYCLIPLRLPIPISYQRIQSIAECKRDLVVAFDGMRIYQCQVTINNFSDISVNVGTGKKATIENHEIYKMAGVEDQLLLLYRKNPNDPGVLFSMNPNEKVPANICKNVVNFAVNHSDSTGNDVAKMPLIAVIVESNVIIYRLSVSETVEGVFHKWVENKNEKFVIGYQCLSIALCYPRSVVLCPSNYIIIDVRQEQPVSSMNSTSTNMENPCIYPIDSNQYFIYSNKSALIFKPSSNSRVSPLKFEAEQIDHKKCGDMFASISKSAVNLYKFDKKEKSKINFPGCQHICTLQNKYFVISNEKQLFLPMECTDFYNQIIDGSLENAIKSLKFVTTDILAAIFEQLWQADFKPLALSMIKVKELQPALIDIVCLFKMIKMDGLESETKYLFFCEQTDDQKVVKFLTDYLLAIRGTNPNENTKRIIDTAIFEIYSDKEEVQKLSEFIDEVPLLSNDSIRAFFNGVNSATYAMYLAFIGNNKEAMEIFKLLENKDTVILDEITQQIIRNSNDWASCKENTLWLKTISPINACKVLTSESVNSDKALQFCQKHFPEFYPTVLYGCLDHKDIMNRGDLINNYVKCISENLLKVNDDDFKRENVAFCKCVMLNPNASISEIEKELGDGLIAVLRRFPKEIDFSNLTYYVKQIHSKSVQVEIYRATGAVDKALALLWGDKVEPDIERLEQFCRENADPSAAFQVLIKLLKEKLPADKEMTILMNLLAQNMSVIDVSSALANINEEQRLDDVASFLESSYRKLVTMRKDAELDAAFASSNMFESEYQRIRLESQLISLTPQTLCPKCKQPIGYQYVYRAPNGDIYHWKCLHLG